MSSGKKEKETVHVWAAKECLLLKGKMLHKGDEVSLESFGEKRQKELLENGSIKEELKSNLKSESKGAESKSYEKKK